MAKGRHDISDRDYQIRFTVRGLNWGERQAEHQPVCWHCDHPATYFVDECKHEKYPASFYACAPCFIRFLRVMRANDPRR